MVLNVSWQDKLTNKELYGNLPPVSSKVGFRRLKLAGHRVRHLEEETSKLFLWEPMSGRMSMERPAVTYKDNLNSNISWKSAKELRTAGIPGEACWIEACSCSAIVVVRGRNTLRSTFHVMLCHQHYFLNQLFGLSNLNYMVHLY